MSSQEIDRSSGTVCSPDRAWSGMVSRFYTTNTYSVPGSSDVASSDSAVGDTMLREAAQRWAGQLSAGQGLATQSTLITISVPER